MNLVITSARLQTTINHKAVGQNPAETPENILGIDPKPWDYGKLSSYDHWSSIGASET